MTVGFFLCAAVLEHCYEEHKDSMQTEREKDRAEDVRGEKERERERGREREKYGRGEKERRRERNIEEERQGRRAYVVC